MALGRNVVSIPTFHLASCFKLMLLSRLDYLTKQPDDSKRRIVVYIVNIFYI